jgi:hypothetical protein
MMNKTFKISIIENISVTDVFISCKKGIRKICKLIEEKTEVNDIQKVVTLSWIPILARCPDDAFLSFNTITKG